MCDFHQVKLRGSIRSCGKLRIIYYVSEKDKTIYVIAVLLMSSTAIFQDLEGRRAFMGSRIGVSPLIGG